LFESGASYMLTYVITSLFAFLGVYVGAILAFIAPDEVKPGMPYFRAFENTLLVFIGIVLLYAYGAQVWVLILLGVVASIFLYFTKETTPINHIAYFALGIAFFFATRTADLFIAVSSMIFMYGLPLGSIYVARHIKKSRKTVLTDVLLNFGFFVIVALMTNLVALFVYNF